MEYFIFTLVCILGSAVQGATSFGYAIVCMAILPFFLPFTTVVIAVQITVVVMTWYMVFRLYDDIDVKLILVPLIVSLVGRIIGVSLLVFINEGTMKKVLGIILVLIAVFFILLKGKIRIKNNAKNAMLAGAISGILGGLSNISGPPLVIYFLSSIEDKKKFHASLQFIFAISGTVSLLTHIYYGNLTMDAIKLSYFGTIAVIFGTSIGLHIFNRISKEFLSKSIYGFMILMGCMMLA